MNRPPLVISIQSQVVLGHVGNSAAVFPMQAAGLQVAAVPTVILSNTPRYPTLRGRALPADLLADLFLGLRERGLLDRAAFIITGYAGSVEAAGLIADLVAEARARNPGLTYLCDPVMGDEGPGLYVPAAIATIIRDRLLPQADIITPNVFELSWLSGIAIRSLADIVRARGLLGLGRDVRVIATGCRLDDTADGDIESVILGPDGISRHSVRRLPVALSGTGDLFTGLIVAGLGQGMPLAGAVDRAQHLTALAMDRAADLGASEVVPNARGLVEALLPGR